MARRRRNVLRRYLEIKEKMGLDKALEQLEKDKDLLPKSTYYWVKKQLANPEIERLCNGNWVIYVLNEDTVIRAPERVCEAIESALITTLMAIMDTLTDESEKIEIFEAIILNKELKSHRTLTYKLAFDIAMYGALAAFEHLGLVQYLPKDVIEELKKNEIIQLESNQVLNKEVKTA